MGIDQKAGGRVKTNRRSEVHGDNPYLKLLVKLYKFLARRTDSKFNQCVATRLCMTRVQKAPMSVHNLSRHMAKQDGKTAVVTGTVTNDIRYMDALPAMKVCALRFTEAARSTIEKAGGECLTFDQLAMLSPTGSNCVLLRGHVKARKVNRHFGKAPGVPNSTTRPYVRRATSLKRKSRKFERARPPRLPRVQGVSSLVEEKRGKNEACAIFGWLVFWWLAAIYRTVFPHSFFSFVDRVWFSPCFVLVSARPRRCFFSGRGTLC
jgi:large subunit ribosomal protein L18e